MAALALAQLREIAGIAAEPARDVHAERSGDPDESPRRVERGAGPAGTAPPVVDAAPAGDDAVGTGDHCTHRRETEREQDETAERGAPYPGGGRLYNSRPACHSAHTSIVIAIAMWSVAPHQIDRVFRLNVPSTRPPAIATSASGIGLP